MRVRNCIAYPVRMVMIWRSAVIRVTALYVNTVHYYALVSHEDHIKQLSVFIMRNQSGEPLQGGTVQLAHSRDTPRAKRRRHPSLPSGYAQQGPTQLSFKRAGPYI